MRIQSPRLTQRHKPLLHWCVQDEAGDTALHLAVSKGHVPAVFHILSSEAAKDVTRWSLRNKCGRTAGELGPLP